MAQYVASLSEVRK